MRPARKRRLVGILVILVGVGVASAITIWSLRQNMLYFMSPSDVQAQAMPAGRQFRLGGLVQQGSVVNSPDGLDWTFTVTDGLANVDVRYAGSLPDLFREGQGVIARGAFNADQAFVATEVLAKHDENYMPPEVADALREAGHPLADPSGDGG